MFSKGRDEVDFVYGKLKLALKKIAVGNVK